MRTEKDEVRRDAKGRDFMPESGLTISVGIVITLLYGGWLEAGSLEDKLKRIPTYV